MEHNDEQIIGLKKELRRQKHSDITGEGVFINGQFVKFRLRNLNEEVGLYLPEGFIDMPEEIKLMKFPSVNRPQWVLTSLDGSVNFTFSFVDSQVPHAQIGSLAAQMKQVLRKPNPAAVFYQDATGRLADGAPICMFDFKGHAIDGPVYNMACLAPFGSKTLYGTFVCLDQDSEEWKGPAWQAFKTIQEAPAQG